MGNIVFIEDIRSREALAVFEQHRQFARFNANELTVLPTQIHVPITWTHQSNLLGDYLHDAVDQQLANLDITWDDNPIHIGTVWMEKYPLHVYNESVVLTQWAEQYSNVLLMIGVRDRGSLQLGIEYDDSGEDVAADVYKRITGLTMTDYPSIW